MQETDTRLIWSRKTNHLYYNSAIIQTHCVFDMIEYKLEIAKTLIISVHKKISGGNEMIFIF